jgi:hypothetical protein
LVPLHTAAAQLVGHWSFDEKSGRVAEDATERAGSLVAATDPVWVDGPVPGAGAVKGDGVEFHMATQGPPLRTDESFSIAAWLRLDSDLVGSRLTLKPDWYALTALAQSGVYHSAFYLGIRNIEYGGEGTGDYHLHWNFTVAPVDGSDDGPVDWVHAHSTTELTDADVDDWVLVVGVYDLEARVARIHLPGRGGDGEEALPHDWPKWSAEERLDVGQAWFRDEFVDQWPGSVGPISAHQGALTDEDVRRLYEPPAPS